MNGGLCRYGFRIPICTICVTLSYYSFRYILFNKMIPLRRLLFYARARSRLNAALCISQPFYEGSRGGNHAKAGFATRPLLMAAAAGVGIVLYDVEGPGGPPRRLQEKFLKVWKPLIRIRIRLITLLRNRILTFIWCGSGFLFDADPDPTLHLDSDPDPDPSF